MWRKSWQEKFFEIHEDWIDHYFIVYNVNISYWFSDVLFKFYFLLIVLQKKIGEENTLFHCIETEAVIIRNVLLMIFVMFSEVDLFLILLSENSDVLFNMLAVLTNILNLYQLCAFHNGVFVIASSIFSVGSNLSNDLLHCGFFYFCNT